MVHVDPPATRPRFHNVEPRSREERLAIRDKDMLEKLRLEHRLKSNVKEDLNSNLLEPPPNSAGFISEADRFCTDAAGEEYAERHRKKLEREVRRERDDGDARERERTWTFFSFVPLTQGHSRAVAVEKKSDDSARAARRLVRTTRVCFSFFSRTRRLTAFTHTHTRNETLRRNSSSVAACVTTNAKPRVGIASPWNKSLRTSNCRS